MTYLLFDLAIGAILLFYLMMGKKKGFILTFFGLVAIFVAFLGATLFSELAAPQVGRLVQPMVEESITMALKEAVDESQWSFELPDVSALSEGETDVLPQLPLEQALTALKDTGVYQFFGPALEGAVSAGTLDLAASAASAIAGYIAREAARLVLFLISFVVVLLGWNLLAHMLDLAFHLPVLSSMNALFGAGAGLIKGILVVFILVWLLKGSILPPEARENTYLLKFFWENSPLTLLAMVWQ